MIRRRIEFRPRPPLVAALAAAFGANVRRHWGDNAEPPAVVGYRLMPLYFAPNAYLVGPFVCRDGFLWRVRWRSGRQFFTDRPYRAAEAIDGWVLHRVTPDLIAAVRGSDYPLAPDAERAATTAVPMRGVHVVLADGSDWALPDVAYEVNPAVELTFHFDAAPGWVGVVET